MTRFAIILVALAAAISACAGRASDPVPSQPGSTEPSAQTTTAAPTVSTTPQARFTPNPPPPGTTVCDRFTAISDSGVVTVSGLTESSGIVASRRHPGVYWVHNDSGSDAVVYAIDATGAELGTWRLDGINPLDWEDIAIGPGPEPDTDYLYVGDIGDNLAFRPDVTVHRFAEPDPRASGVVSDVAALRFGYPIVPTDAEAMFVDPVEGDLFVITKTDTGASIVLQAQAPSIGSDPIIPMVAVATLNLGPGSFVTAADISPDGTTVALRGYEETWMWPRIEREVAGAFIGEPCPGPSPNEVQGEALAFTADGTAFVTVSEGTNPTLWLVGP